MDGNTRSLARKNTQWMEDLYFAVKVVRQKLTKYCPNVTPTTSLLHIVGPILDLFRKFWSFRKWDKMMDIHSEYQTCYNTHYQGVLVKYMENEYFAKLRQRSVNTPANISNSNLFPTVNAAGFMQSSVDLYGL